MQSEHSSTSQESRQSRPGQRLKLLREAAGLSLADVAEQTRIARSRLEALERDDYLAAGQAPAYVVGYLRTYARLLQCPVEPWLSDLEQQLRAKAHSQEQQGAPEPVLVDAHHHYRLIPWVAILVAALLVWLLGAQFYGAQNRMLHQVTSPELVQLSELSATHTVAKDLVTPNEPPAISSEGPTATELVASTPLAASNPQAPAFDQQVINVGPDGTGDALLVNASGDCWISVQDSNGKELIARVLHSGDHLRLFGSAPFNIRLGDARFVSVWLNSRAVPVNPSKDRRTLRLVAAPEY